MDCRKLFLVLHLFKAYDNHANVKHKASVLRAPALHGLLFVRHFAWSSHLLRARKRALGARHLKQDTCEEKPETQTHEAFKHFCRVLYSELGWVGAVSSSL